MSYQPPQYPGQHHPGQHYRGQTHSQPPRRNGLPGWAIALIVVAGVLALLIPVAILGASVGGLADRAEQSRDEVSTGVDEDSATAPSSVPSIEAATTFIMGERPGFAAMAEHVNGLYEHYDAARDDGSIYEVAPDGRQTSSTYIHDFVLLLMDHSFAVDLSYGLQGTDPDELDDLIQARVDDVDELERRFLAGESFDVSITITDENGNAYESDGANVPNGQVPGGEADSNPEEFARQYEGAPDSEGSYIPAAEELLSEFDVYLDFNYDNFYDHCSGSNLGRDAAAASFCSASPNVIYIQDDNSSYPALYYDRAFLDLVRHELAHAQIFELCGTSFPPAAGSANEGVTNSYAAMYLGMDPSYAANVAQTHPEYGISPETDAIAEQIQRGNCE